MTSEIRLERPPAPDPSALAQFESRLAPRTKVPSQRLREFFAWPADKVRRESEIVTQILRRFAEAVVDAIDEPARTDQFLRGLDLKAISRDHDWRTIFSTLRAQETGSGEYQRAVLIKYLQYLSFRKRLLDYILARKQGLQETGEHSDVTLYPKVDDEPGRGPLFEPPTRIARERAGEAFVRLATGENVDLKLDEGERIDIRLANHEFRLVGARPPCLVDENDVMYFLRPGRNMVGRHPESDVPIDPNFGQVSRAHLIIEWESGRTLRLIDLSSRGTFLRRGILTRARRLDA
ncbi:MAG: FHA domain-containing protein [Gammaproteobacteria bacterium]|nr:FHA domain-containing protein [Gammaproteobacteria bacterium]